MGLQTCYRLPYNLQPATACKIAKYQDTKMKAAMFCLFLALFVAIEAAPMDEAEVGTQIETRADAKENPINDVLKIAMIVMLEEVQAENGQVNVDFLHQLQARFEANLVKPEGALQQCRAELGCWAAFLKAKATIEEFTSKPIAPYCLVESCVLGVCVCIG